MQIHELNNYTGDLDSGAYLAVDNGYDTGKVSAEKIVRGVSDDVSALETTLNARIDNIIAGGDAPSEAEITDARRGADDINYVSLGSAIRSQFDAFKVLQTQTNNLWDGSWGLAQANPITGTSAHYLVYGPIIPVTAGDYYSVGIVSNMLPAKVNVIAVRFYDGNGTALGSVHTLYKNGGYLDWIQAPTGATQALVLFNTNDGSISLTPTEVKQAGYKVVFENRLLNFTSRDGAGRYAFSASEWEPSFVWSDEALDRIITVPITVGPSNANFTSLRDACDWIDTKGNASEKLRYEIRLQEGTYDISSYYSSVEKATPGFVGLIVPDWTTIKGIGNREKTILAYVLTAPDNNICVLNLKNTCSLENLTLYGVKTRYCVHDDKANGIGIPYSRYCKNVHFKGDEMTYGAVYGAGINSNAEWIFEDCIFESLTETSYQNCFSVHSSGQANQVGSNQVTFDNCRFIGHGSLNNALILSTVMSTSNGYQDYCKLRGCKANGRLILREENASLYGAGILWWATGYATTFTDIIINNTDGEDYSANVDII